MPWLFVKGLRASNRQLRRETNIVLKSGDVEIPFLLGIVLVKEIGVFLTWTSFTYQPEHFRLLTLNIRDPPDLIEYSTCPCGPSFAACALSITRRGRKAVLSWEV